MDNSEYDRLRQAYKDVVDAWVASIREEEALALPDHSMVAMERWDTACFTEQDGQEQASDDDGHGTRFHHAHTIAPPPAMRKSWHAGLCVLEYRTMLKLEAIAAFVAGKQRGK